MPISSRVSPMFSSSSFKVSVLLFFFFDGTGVWTEGLLIPGQVLYHFNHSISPQGFSSYIKIFDPFGLTFVQGENLISVFYMLISTFPYTICWKNTLWLCKLHILFYLRNKISKFLTNSWLYIKTIKCSGFWKTNQRLLIRRSWDQCLSCSFWDVHLI
jgi:hypothetical protein